MNARIFGLLAVILAFGALSTLALMDVGYIGLITSHMQGYAGMQVLIDLVILAVLACIWMVHDAPRHGISAWPFVAVTLLAGSFGPLFYLLLREFKARMVQSAASTL